MLVRINFGCGTTPTKGWINLDNSYALKLKKYYLLVPLLKKLNLLSRPQLRNIEFNRKENIVFADASKKFNFENNSVDVIYTSHMLEHLSRNSANHFIKECNRVLKKGGILRIVVPNIKKIIDDYLLKRDADAFLERTLLVAPSLDSLKLKIQFFLVGYRHHQWMYDGKSLQKLLFKNGFENSIEQLPGQTLILNPDNLNLSERSEESIYIEAIK
tara:strand:+ start:229 stop:873 length:645 start_codon:yes stop_codon:yes gene_type:complete